MALTNLFIISSDPRSSHRPAEAIRIAAGVGAWNSGVEVYLAGPAVLMLTDKPGTLLDEENFTRYLPMLTEGKNIYVEAGNRFLAELNESSDYRRQELSPEQFDMLNIGGITLYKTGIILFNLVPCIAFYLVK